MILSFVSCKILCIVKNTNYNKRKYCYQQKQGEKNIKEDSPKV